MKSAKQKVFSVFSIIFYSMFFSLFLSAFLKYDWHYLDHMIVAAVCAVILGAMTAVKKERIVMAVSAATCVTGFAAFGIFGDHYPKVGAVYRGYLILFLLVLILLLGKKKEKQKVFKIVQMVMVGLLFVNAVAEVFITNYYHHHYYYYESDFTLVRTASLCNSLASLFWGMWVINFMQYGKKSTDDISLENPKELPS